MTRPLPVPPPKIHDITVTDTLKQTLDDILCIGFDGPNLYVLRIPPQPDSDSVLREIRKRLRDRGSLSPQSEITLNIMVGKNLVYHEFSMRDAQIYAQRVI